MKRYTWAGIVILSLVLSACNASTPLEPTSDAESVQATAVAAAFTIVAETQAAIPTNTDIPATETPTPIVIPTETPIPSFLTPTALDLLTSTPTIVPTITSQPSSPASSADPCNKPLTSWKGPSVSIDITYDYKPQGKDDKVVLSLWVMTDQGECGFLSDLSTGPVGQYSALAFVDGPKDFKVSGGFRLTEAAWNIVIRNDSIVALGGCYPNC